MHLAMVLLAACGGPTENPAADNPSTTPSGQPGMGGQPGQPGMGGEGGQPGMGGEGGQLGQPGQPGMGGQPGQPGMGGEGGQPGQPGMGGPGGPSKSPELNPTGTPTCQAVGSLRVASGEAEVPIGMVRVHSSTDGDCAWTEDNMIFQAPGRLVSATPTLLITSLGEGSPVEYIVQNINSGEQQSRFAVWTEKTSTPTTEGETTVVPGMLINAGKCLSQQTEGACTDRINTCWEAFKSAPEGVQIQDATLSCPEAAENSTCMLSLYADAQLSAGATLPVISGEVRCMALQPQ